MGKWRWKRHWKVVELGRLPQFQSSVNHKLLNTFRNSFLNLNSTHSLRNSLSLPLSSQEASSAYFNKNWKSTFSDAIANNIDGNFPGSRSRSLVIITLFLPQLIISLAPSSVHNEQYFEEITRKSLVQIASNIYTADRIESILCLSGGWDSSGGRKLCKCSCHAAKKTVIN